MCALRCAGRKPHPSYRGAAWGCQWPRNPCRGRRDGPVCSGIGEDRVVNTAGCHRSGNVKQVTRWYGPITVRTNLPYSGDGPDSVDHGTPDFLALHNAPRRSSNPHLTTLRWALPPPVRSHHGADISPTPRRRAKERRARQNRLLSTDVAFSGSGNTHLTAFESVLSTHTLPIR